MGTEKKNSKSKNLMEQWRDKKIYVDKWTRNET